MPMLDILKLMHVIIDTVMIGIFAIVESLLLNLVSEFLHPENYYQLTSNSVMFLYHLPPKPHSNPNVWTSVGNRRKRCAFLGF